MTKTWRLWLCIAAVLCWTVLLLIPIPATDWGLDDAPGWELPLASVAHVMGYMILTIAAGWLQAPPKMRLWLLFALCAHGVVMELVQPSFAREASVEDAVFDHLGVFLGLILARRYWFA